MSFCSSYDLESLQGFSEVNGLPRDRNISRDCQTTACFGLLHHHVVLGSGLGGRAAGNLPCSKCPAPGLAPLRAPAGMGRQSLTGDQDLPGTFYSQCISFPKKEPQADFGDDGRCSASLPFPFSFPIHCRIIISFSRFHRDVFNNGSPGCFAQ